jgi:hypothetical protein
MLPRRATPSQRPLVIFMKISRRWRIQAGLKTGLLWVSLLLTGLSVAAQLVSDREPMGPCSRKTGWVISEIMFAPRLVTPLTNDSLEFIEIHNSEPWENNLGGFSLDGAVHFVFPSNTLLAAHAYLVVARQPDLVQTYYGITNVLGPWDGASTNRLPIGRGLVRLRNAQGALLLEVNYSDNPPWPLAAGGKGHSLVLARPSFGEADVRAWTESDCLDGSPGRADPVPTNEPLASLLINEWGAHDKEYIELYNHGNAAVDLSGAYLTDSSDTNKFRIPVGTTIEARGFKVFDYDNHTLNFRLFAGGEKLFLLNSNLTRVIDAIQFEGQSNSVANGRWPDGGPYHYGMPATPGASNRAPVRYAVVINELMYNPISGDSDDEYVELYNRGSTAVNLSAWSFINGITYTFPSGSSSTLPAGGYCVLAKNPTNLLTLYPNLNSNSTFGPYQGTLANGGERVTLAAADYDTVDGVSVKLNVIVCDVTYATGGQWGDWSDGSGSSLELIDPEADPHLPANWANSDESAKSPWTAIEFNGPLGQTLGSNVNDSLIVLLQGTGECLVDELEVRADLGPNRVVNGGFESGLDGWFLQGSHDGSSLEESGFAGGRSLRLRAGSRGDNQSNRILSSPFASPIGPEAATVSLRAKARWLRGSPELLLRLHGGAAEAYGRLAVPRNLGTPGAVNNRRISNAGPGIFQVQHTPLLPAENEPVVVSARAFDRQGLATFTLHYRVDPSPDYISIPLLDTGSEGDAVAQDGICTATIPGQPAGTVVAFYLEAKDSLNASSTFPRDVFPPPGRPRCWPNDAVAREGVVRWGEIQMPSEFPTYHLWLSSANSNRWHTRDAMNNTPVDGTFVYNNSRVIYNALPYFSGSPWHRAQMTNGPTGPNRVDYQMNFPDDDRLLGATDFVLNNPGNPTLTSISDLSAVAEQAAYKIFEDLGMIHNHRRYAHVFVNGHERSATPQRPGHFISEDSQQPNGDMLDQWFPDSPGGLLYKLDDWMEFEPNGYDIAANHDADLVLRTVLLNGQPTFLPAPYRYMFRRRAAGSPNDYSSVFALVDAVSPAANPTNAIIDPVAFGAVADYEDWMRVFAVQRAVGNWDSYGWERGKNDYLYKPSNGPWRHLTFDIDRAMGLDTNATAALFTANDPRVRAMFNTPDFVRAYWRAFSDLVNGPFRNENLDPFLDSRTAALTNNGVNVDLEAVEAIKTYIRDRRAYLQSQLATVAVPFALDGPAAFSTTNNLLFLTGTAPIEVKAITLNGLAYPFEWTSATTFLVRVVLSAEFTTLTLQGIDRFGQALPGASRALNVDYTGPVVEPAGSLIISEIMAAPAAPGGQFLEIINRSAQNFDLSGWRLDGLNLTFQPGSIVTNGQFLVLAESKTAFAAAYAAIPVFGVFGASLLPQGQTLALVRTGAAGDEVIDAVRYEATAPWPAVVPGASLQLIDATQDNSRASNWATDPVALATPGTTNSVAAALTPYDPLWLNEVQTENLSGPTDNFDERDPWLELYNAGQTTLSLDGYYLADNCTTNLAQWSFPPGTTLEPGENKLIWADGQPDQTSDTALHTSFRLDYTGTLALVRQLDSGPQIADYLTWDVLGANASYGSCPDGQPVFRYVLHNPSPGGTNLEPAVRVFINEWMSKNTIGTHDPADSATDDWIELYNAEAHPVDLSGCYLTDDAANPTKFQVPTNGQYRIPAGGFLLVWADDQAAQNTPARADLHVNFKLNSTAGSIGLVAPNGLTMLDLVTYGQQTNDVSEGRYTDGASARYFMTNSTPRSLNAIPDYNTAPRLPLFTNQFVSPGQTSSLNIRPRDPDMPRQSFTYELLSGPPGSFIALLNYFRWIVPTNQAPGVYPVTVRVTDNGVPPRSDVETFTVTVRSPGVVTGTPAPVIRSVVSLSGQVTFTFETLPGHTYRVVYSDDLPAGRWTQLDVDFVAANTSASITDTVAVPHRFYQVIQVE